MLRIKEDSRQYLKNDLDLFQSMDWIVLEDPKLDDAHYVVAARRFGDWVEQSFIEEDKTATSKRIRNGPDGWRPGTDPRHGVFVYANEDAVNSVVEHPDSADKERAKDYFLYLVNYEAVLDNEKNNQDIIDMVARKDAGQSRPGDEAIGNSLDDVTDLEKQDLDLADYSQEWRYFRRRFRASELVPGYTAVEEEFGWDYGFDLSEHDIWEPAMFDTNACRKDI